MSTQQKLTALLHELQHARSPLAQARVLTRAWRTLRELSPTDRQLLARHAGFDGAEEILDGLSRRKGGLAPAMLLRVLANARATDETSISKLLEAVRDPERREDAISMGVEFASDLLSEPQAEQQEEEVGDALGELQAVEETIIETPEEALAALNAIEPDPNEGFDGTLVAESGPAPVSDSEEAPETETSDEPPSISPPEPPPPPPEPVVDWDRWRIDTGGEAPISSPDPAPSISDVGSRPFKARAVMEAMGAEQSVFSQLRVLHRELGGFAGSSLGTLHELVETFPDGWARRRALCALLEAGIPVEASDAIELIMSLDRESDRRWCLRILASRGKLGGAVLKRALALVDSPYAKKRLESQAG